MKQLNVDGTITIPSNIPRTRRGPDSRGIRICFAEIGRSCSLQTGYLIFTDGSAYEYSAPGNSDVEQLCAALQRGKMFNFSVRRSRGGYTRGFTPPADYETIYSYPPYPGIAPVACPLVTVDWSQLLWLVVSEVPCGGTSWGWTHNGTQGNSQRLGVTNGTFICTATWQTSASLSYNGPAQNANLNLDVETFNPGGDWDQTVTVDVNGVNVLTDARSGPADALVDIPFVVPDTGGAFHTVSVQILYTTHCGFGHSNFFSIATFTDV